MELQLGLVADTAHADAAGKLYILGEFRYLATAKVPAFHPQMALVLRIAAPAVEVPTGTAKLRLQFVDIDGHKVLPQNPPEMDIRFAPVGPAERGTVNAQVILTIGNLAIPVYGDYVIHVWVNNARLGEVKFHVLQLPTPPAAPAPSK